ncbi:IclR family transcriptional regulator [Arthrobacter sp. EPSL27]|uniref:IclR family transcriptional regulator n=1 Tax=Arthrobacter sp. EPSL27 TaxID=1745378 RepID=UPI0008372812|nr:IclR family transcriptional regulator [Arthrobacter sp. EPSL27]
MEEKQIGSIQSVKNALKMIESIGELQPVGVSELSRHVGLPKSSVQRALTTLGNAGWIKQLPDDQSRWQLTTVMLAISLMAFGEHSLVELADPAMRELQQRTGETIHLISLDGDSGLILHRVDSEHTVRTFVPVGTRSPLHATAAGQAMLAFMPPETTDEILRRSLGSFTEQTVTDPAVLIERLEVVRERGYAVNVAEWRREVASISCAIRAAHGAVVGALTISIPLSRFSESLVPLYGSWLKELTESITPISSRRV